MLDLQCRINDILNEPYQADPNHPMNASNFDTGLFGKIGSEEGIYGNIVSDSCSSVSTISGHSSNRAEEDDRRTAMKEDVKNWSKNPDKK